ncbi:phage major capsid protein [Anaerococcus murdochii]|uniref:Phage major capsid protein n=1 Tax=Anaerococcus murdochii TaxID=411577 RepID=A0ABS7SYT0_9FIRM|nr:phage major capsid protein [Anaerococcus murdochii]MBZ2386680.1 phage major capsid protein [Anaerococcus murdochii]
MSLRVLLLRKKLEERKNKLGLIEEEIKAIKKREDETAQAIDEIDESTSEEDAKTVEEIVEGLEKEKADKVGEKTQLEKEIEEIEKEISDIEEDNEEETETEEGEQRKIEKKEVLTRGLSMNFDNMNTRERVGQILDRSEENRKFFRDVVDLYFNRAALAGMTTETAGFMVPDDVYYEISQRIGEYGSLYNIVRKLELVGKARIIMNAGTPTMYWTEKCEPLKEVTLGELNAIELDNYKLGGYLFLCESFVQDVNENRHHNITIANYIMNEFAKAIAEALDKAIYEGKGAAAKEPEGICSVIKTTKTVSNILEVLGHIGELDTQFYEHNAKEGTITLVANRKTLYKCIYPETWGKDSNGKFVYGMGNNLPDGTRILLSNVIKDDEVVIGDFNQYILGERKDMAFDTNDRLQWIEENIGYKIRGRYDGKVANPKAFVRLKFKETATPSTGA